MNLREEAERIVLDGYSQENAESKLCQDIILKAISDSNMAKNATIKGGVVMRSISDNARRATQDIDIDLIRYSISDESIRAFIEKLDCIDGIKIASDGQIIELNHQDYKGKRITITISDEYDNVLSLKMDIGVHKDLDINQDTYSFDIGFQDDAVSLLINSPAQMIAEKLKSLLRFGTRSTRYRDVFDICYLIDVVDKKQLYQCMQKYIFEDDTISINNIQDALIRLEQTLGNESFLQNVSQSRRNWLDMSVEDIASKDLSFFRSLARDITDRHI